MIFLATACDEESTLIFSEMSYTSEENAIIDVNIPQAEGTSEVSNKINAAINELVTNSIDFNDDIVNNSSIEEAANSFNQEYASYVKQIADVTQPWEAFVDGEVTYQSPEVICIAFNTYLNTGGVHGNSVISFLNFNPTNGDIYHLEDVVNDLPGFTKLSMAYFEKEINSSTGANEFRGLENFSLPEAIGVSDDGVILVYNSFELKGYSIPLLEFTIPFEEASLFLKVD